MLVVEIPWPRRDLSPNARVHYLARSRIARKYRLDCYHLALAALQGQRPAFRNVDATFEFFPPDRRRRDTDNIIASLKSAQDGLADAIKCDDNKWRTTYTMREPIDGGQIRVTITERKESE